jgi:hypothetical protein
MEKVLAVTIEPSYDFSVFESVPTDNTFFFSMEKSSTPLVF